MATEVQIAASRLNARLSIGPRSAEGKVQSSQNAITHGLTANTGLLASESPKEFFELRESVFEELMPESVLEIEFVDRIVNILWRLRRVPAFEAALLAWVQASREGAERADT
jgi:hypothetical protein